MRVRRVEILRSEGVDPGFAIEGLGDGLTIIEGRNESGKTTLARAIRALLWPTAQYHLQARGVFVGNGREFHAFVDTHGGGWQGEAPRMPDPSAGRGIIVGIADLWREDDHDEAVRRAMARELQGGYDLSPLRDGAAPSSPTKPMRDLRDAERRLHGARAQTQALVEREATLPELRERAEELRREAAARGHLGKALERLDLVENLARQRHELEAMPDGALRVNGDEAERLEELRDAIESARASMRREERLAREALEAARDLGLPETGVAEGDLRLLDQLGSQAVALQAQLADAQRQADRAQAEANAVGADPKPMDADALAALDAALDTVQRTRERLHHDREAAERSPPPRGERTRRALALAAAGGALLAGLAAALASAWVALALSLASAAAGLALLLGKRPDHAHRGAHLREQAERSARAHEDALASLRELAGEDGELLSTLSLVTAARRADRQDKLVRELRAARAGVESLREQLGSVLERASAALAPYATQGCDSADALTRLLADLRHRAAEHRRQLDAHAQALERLAESRERLGRAQEKYRVFLDGLGLAEDHLDDLAHWLRLRERARELDERVRFSEAKLRELDQTLADGPGLLELDRPALERRLRACEDADARADELNQQIGRIEGDVARAQEAASVNEALGAYERAVAAVAEARDHECAMAARRLILDRAAADIQREDLPALLKAADDLLGRFTGRTYGLTVDPTGQPAVRDHRVGVVRGYDQLSTGTRAQALLAMRLAGALEAERRAGATPLPLVLDEPLATTDDQRFEAVARAVLGLAQDGRQLLYLTCEPAHVHRLERIAGELGVACVRFDLDAIRGQQATARNAPEALLEPKAAPSPNSMDRRDYLERRGVQPLDPWQHTDAIDLYHLMPADLRTLHELGKRGLTTVGQVLAERRRLGEAFAWPGAARAADVASGLVRAWRRGRARPLTTQDLLDSGAVSDSFIDGLASLNRDLEGQARALLDAIDARQDDRVKGFRASKADDLRAYFERNSLLPSEPTLARAELLSKALEGLDASCRDVSEDVDEDERAALLDMANRLLDTLDDAARTTPRRPAEALRPE